MIFEEYETAVGNCQARYMCPAYYVVSLYKMKFESE